MYLHQGSGIPVAACPTPSSCPLPTRPSWQCLLLQGLFLANVRVTDELVMPYITHLSALLGLSPSIRARCAPALVERGVRVCFWGGGG
jgi:hypothetical protein